MATMSLPSDILVQDSDDGTNPTSNFVPRFNDAQVNRSIKHPLLPQPSSDKEGNARSKEIMDENQPSNQPTAMSHTFVVVADTQFGMMNENRDWEIEMRYSREAVRQINALQPRPLYCCICGDLVDMTSSIYKGKPKRFIPRKNSTSTATSNTINDDDIWTEAECDIIQEQQNNAMKEIWYNLHPDIALICLCGNHDVGNRPTPLTIQKYISTFGDDYLSFWVNGTFNIVVNSSLFSDPTDTMCLYTAQLQWLEQQLICAQKHSPRNIFIFSHHPWFLYNEDEDVDDLKGISYLIPGNTDLFVPDSYFPIPKRYREQAISLFRQYHVSACFAGHFHQNLISESSFGMDMIITGSLSMVLQSTGNTNQLGEASTQGFRLVTVDHKQSGGRSSYAHRFIGIGDKIDIVP